MNRPIGISFVVRCYSLYGHSDHNASCRRYTRICPWSLNQVFKIGEIQRRKIDKTQFRKIDKTQNEQRAKKRPINGSGLVGWEQPILPPESLQCQWVSTFDDSSEDASRSRIPDTTNVPKTSLFHPTSPQLLLSHSTKEVGLGRYPFYARDPLPVRKKN